MSQPSGVQPRALVVTIYGLYARRAGGWLSVAALIRLMSEFGVDAPATRSLISRLKQRGILQARRAGEVAGYALSQSAWHMLDEGDRRIFDRARGRLADGWLLAVFSVPEAERQKRHTLRSRLTWLGFGTVSSGVWIAPEHLYDETRDVLEHYGLTDYVELFRSGRLAGDDPAGRVRTWWDLDGLQALYEEFLDSYRPVSARWRPRRTADDGEAFADYVRAVTAWRRLPYLDPGLPPEVLPADWSGLRAAELFATLRAQLDEPARRHVLTVTGAG